MSSANRESFTSSFPIWIPFISFYSPIAIVRTFKTTLNNSGERGQPCLLPDLSGNAFSFSQLPQSSKTCRRKLLEISLVNGIFNTIAIGIDEDIYHFCFNFYFSDN